MVSLAIFFIAQLCFAQRIASAVPPEYNFYIDSTSKILPASEDELIVDVRTVSDNIFDKYINDPAFNYEGNPKEADDWISKIRNWINQQLIILTSTKVYSTLLDVLYYGLMIMAVLLIIRGLIKADRRGFLFGKTKTDDFRLIENEEDITQINLDDLITNALDNKQYKLAIRYFYLKSLKILSERGLIELRNNKTNYQYLTEIKNNRIADAFRVTTNRFEWIWYGDFPVDDELMKNSQTEFNQFFAMLNTR